MEDIKKLKEFMTDAHTTLDTAVSVLEVKCADISFLSPENVMVKKVVVRTGVRKVVEDLKAIRDRVGH